MRNGAKIGVVIPARNEARAIPLVVAEIPAWVDVIMVADNDSTDGTPDIATAAGARVVSAPERGYGAACLAGLAALPPVDIVVFVDGDLSDYPGDMADLVDPIIGDVCDFVVGSRALGVCAPGSLTPQQRFGNWLAAWLIRWRWGVPITDLGPFRAIRRTTLDSLAMQDRTYGWTVEMQLKAIQHGVRLMEIPVRYRRRIGVSKVSGTVRGTVLAGVKILSLIARHALWSRTGPRRD